MNFNDKVVIVTGASGGIGAVIALEFARSGAQLVLAARNENNLETIANKCKTYNGIQPLIIQADISINEDNVKIIEETIRKFNKIDVIVNNAAYILIKDFEDSSVDDFDAVMSTNVRSVFHLTKLAVPYLEASKGNVVNISSVAATITVAALSLYAASKACLDSLTRSMALELAPKGIRVNTVNPGATKTQKADAIVSKDYTKEIPVPKCVTDAIPLRKMADSEDVAAAVLFLASDAARSTTGASYYVDCGGSLAPIGPKSF